ncbi:hypothetical protein BVRB_7g161900 [Beta vulgaris subsp. vulgaris]|uniref:uncharacterized protein LOC104898675 isoform X1 n=2 Tax=Beta vulgaris subsp. vulgaris TaxID=3555 RepID=UPI00053FB135|nr:uncharacterized protein LOC104898675 isoform X1 [Beta vulgaris subsp. vulgaris]XP_010684083.1 uncharacterized protein LOC104898675 isoform X1 [Beta vulgaris subsp. vulgaris]KMT06265.1 hypothetical protein BVRB_7g161900 [Beta vulgaris subsp. vulgaris]
MAENHGTSVEVFQKQEKNGMIKRKRLDARAFRKLHAKVRTNIVVSASTPESRDVKMQDCDDNLEASCKKQKIDSEVNVQLGDEEATLEKCDTRVPQGYEQTDSSKNIPLHEVLAAKEKSEERPDCNTRLPRYIEYWVPVGFSYVQLEKYCETLFKNSMLLCSSLKNEILDNLHDILTRIRKCCDHPYLLDPSLQTFVNGGLKIGDYLSNGIEVSGKFFLLDKLLQEVKEKQLRVLIVFQWNDSKPPAIKLQHILDDLICEKVGTECYIHIYREFDSTKKRDAVDLFNDKDSGKLVMLMEKSSCQPSIKLSSLDCVILFNSDWNPINDMKSLRKMSIQSKFEHLKVFRLYSPNTVEEKALTLAKEGIALESNLNCFTHSISHMLLLWGSSYLFSKLDEFHSHCSSISNLNCLSENKWVLDVHNELSTLLSCQDRDDISCSFISKVPEANNDYSQNIALHGEQDEPARADDLPPFVIWNSLFEGRNPPWKLLPGSLEKVRRRSELLASPTQCMECKVEDTKMTSKKTSRSDDGFPCLKPRMRKVSRPALGRSDKEVAGHLKFPGNAVKLSSCRDDYSGLSNIECHIEETCLRRMRELILKQKKEIREFYRTKREDRAKLEEEHQLEVDLVNQRYRETAHKKEQLKNLDLIYEQKLQEHNCQMDKKRKELEDEHLASRIKEKKMKDKLFALLKTKNMGLSTISAVKLSLLETVLGQENVVEDPIDSTILLPNTALVSENKHSQEIEHSPDHVLTETEILSFESDEENNAVSMPREEKCDTAVHNDLIAFANRASTSTSTSTSLCESPSHATLHASNREIEGDGSTNMESSKEIMDGMTPMCLVSGSLESDGENDIAVEPSEKALDTCIEVLNCGSNLYTSNEPQLHASSGQSCAESLSNLPNTEVPVASNGEAEMSGAAESATITTMAAQLEIEWVQDKNHNIEDAVRTSNGEDDMRGDVDSITTTAVAVPEKIERVQDGKRDIETPVGTSNENSEMGGAADSGTTASGKQRMEDGLDGDCNIRSPVRAVNVEVEMRGALDSGSTASLAVAEQQRIEEVQDGNSNMEAPIAFNGEAETRGAADLDTTTTLVGEQRIEKLSEFPSSTLVVGSQVLVQAQTCRVTGNLSHLEQPMVSVNLPSHEIRQTAGASAMSSYQTTRLHVPSQPGQTQVPSRNTGLSHQLVVQSQLQRSSGSDQPHISNSGGAAIMQSANSYVQETSSLRSNLLSSAASCLLQNELDRMVKERQEAVKIHEDKTTQLKSACEKEIQDIQHKYDMLLKEAGNALLHKKLEMESLYRKVYANKLLADTLKSSNEKLTSCPMSQEALLSAILQLPQFNLHVQSTSTVSAEPMPPPVQVVHQLSELVTFDATTPPNSSTVYNTGSPLAGYHERFSNISVPLYGVMNQQIAAWPRTSLSSWHQEQYSPGSSLQFGNTRQNPLQL